MYMPVNAPGVKKILRLRRHLIKRSSASACSCIQPVGECMVYFGYLAQLITGWESGKEKV